MKSIVYRPSRDSTATNDVRQIYEPLPPLAVKMAVAVVVVVVWLAGWLAQLCMTITATTTSNTIVTIQSPVHTYTNIQLKRQETAEKTVHKHSQTSTERLHPTFDRIEVSRSRFVRLRRSRKN